MGSHHDEDTDGAGLWCNIKVSAGGITFGDFMDFLSVLSKGSQRDKVTDVFVFFKKDLLCKVFGQIGIGIGTEG